MKIQNRTALFLLALLLSRPWSALAGDGFSIVRDGRPTAVIVVPDHAIPAENYAARELQYHVRKSTGAELSVQGESAPVPEGMGRILLGRAASPQGAELPPNAFTIKTGADALRIYGHDQDGDPQQPTVHAGTLHGVYELLEKEVGVRWLWPGELGEVIPARRSLSVAPGDSTTVPRLVHSRVRSNTGLTKTGWSSLEARDRYLQAQRVFLRRHRMAEGTSLEYGHAFEDYWGRFGATHPEYFNQLPDGTRTSDKLYFGGEPQLISMCVANPGFHRQVVEDWKKNRTYLPWVNVAENDTEGKCVCADCLAWDRHAKGEKVSLEAARAAFRAGEPGWAAHLGSLTDRYAKFYLAVQAEAQKTDPQAVVLGYAYANYSAPPVETKLNERVIIAVVPPVMFPWNDANREAFRKQWQGWRDSGVRLYLRPNYTLDGHNFPIYYATAFGEDFRFAFERGMIATDFDSLTGQWAAQGPNLYVLMRAHTHGDRPVGEILDEYYSAFGPAKKQVRDYFAHWETVSNKTAEASFGKEAAREDPAGGHWATFYRVAHVIFTPKIMAEGRRRLAAAAAAAKGDPVASRRVEFLEMGLRNAELTLAAQAAHRAYTERGDIAGYQQALKALYDFRASVEPHHTANMGYLGTREAATWQEGVAQLDMKRDKPVGPWRFAFDPSNEGVAKGWQEPAFDDASWSAIEVTKPWEDQPVGQEWAGKHGAPYNGIAWYRTTLDIPHPPAGRVVLQFGAVDEACQVWLNGKKLLDRPYPFEGDRESWTKPFQVDVTDALSPEGRNLLAVRVEDAAGAGGVWRPVWLQSYGAPVAEGSNRIPNGDFEEQGQSWRHDVRVGRFDFAYDMDVAHGGTTSGRLACAERLDQEPERNAGRAWGRWYQTGVPVTPGKKHRFRAWVRTADDYGGRIEIWVKGNQSYEAKLLSTSGLWQEVVLEDVVSDAGSVAIYLNSYDGLGDVWFDDVSLVEQQD